MGQAGQFEIVDTYGSIYQLIGGSMNNGLVSGVIAGSNRVTEMGKLRAAIAKAS